LLQMNCCRYPAADALRLPYKKARKCGEADRERAGKTAAVALRLPYNKARKREGAVVKISVLTIMPGLFGSFLESPVVARSIRNGALEVEIIDIRDYAPGSFRHIDDSPFGGGAGMVMRCQPVLDALRACKKKEAESRTCRREGQPVVTEEKQAALQEPGPVPGEKVSGTQKPEDASHSYTVLFSPAGTPYTQAKAHAFSAMSHLILLCGHYEGMDARIEPHADELVSIGDYVLTGGELAAQVIIDSVARLLPGSLREASTLEESFENGLLEYPQYTQPAVYEGREVPEVLRSGDHGRIRRWRLQQSLLRTRKLRPDLFEAHVLTQEEKELLEEEPEE
ncbi:MAG: tRNA (guanosine(37)-N1)-methyltransferase TrmD, partial [Eubacteriales bacterium]|nr:tRNA (guanosine(37)-N1)-methyltransferase TrmD [Eubacteriales bacterium]